MIPPCDGARHDAMEGAAAFTTPSLPFGRIVPSASPSAIPSGYSPWHQANEMNQTNQMPSAAHAPTAPHAPALPPAFHIASAAVQFPPPTTHRFIKRSTNAHHSLPSAPMPAAAMPASGGVYSPSRPLNPLPSPSSRFPSSSSTPFLSLLAPNAPVQDHLQGSHVRPMIGCDAHTPMHAPASALIPIHTPIPMPPPSSGTPPSPTPPDAMFEQGDTSTMSEYSHSLEGRRRVVAGPARPPELSLP